MTDTRPDTAPHGERTPTPDTGRRKMSADWLRYVPPAAALGTAFVLQVMAMTDTVGSVLAKTYGQPAYVAALLLGVSVASCAEGGAAYLMDLYDKHLLAGDSVWILRATMLAYVAASAGVIHWWLASRHLPTIISWVLAGMSASALYLWSRGARWRRRDVMRKQGLIDPAMPRFTLAAKLFHPIRWFNTIRLISWEPVRTTAEARARYETWRTQRAKPSTVTATDSGKADRPATAATRPPVRATVRPTPPADMAPNVLQLTAGGQRRGSALPTVDELADTIGRHHGQRTIGKPTALEVLRREYGSCSTDRAIAAKDRHNARVSRGEPADADEPHRAVPVSA